MSVQLVQSGVKFPDNTVQTTASTGQVSSVNGMTGAVTVTAPVTSVNGLTGAVVLPSFVGWNLTYYNYGLSHGSFYAVPANCIGFYCWVSIYGGSNQGARVYCMLRNKSNVDYFNFYIGGSNENNGNDGGSGMSDSMSAFVPIDPANVGYVYFYCSNSGRNFSGYIQAFVTKA